MTGDNCGNAKIFKTVLYGAAAFLMSTQLVRAVDVQIEINPDKVVRSMDRHRLLGSNLALWHEASQLFDADLQEWMRKLHPSYLRIPGGSWSDEYYWNGNGVWSDGVFDLTKLEDGYWDVDFSAYAPGFRVQGPDRIPADYHGGVDVKALHELIALEGAESIVTVNAGTGKPELAAEWVRWANKVNDYHIKHWEIGNELEGAWELGHFLPDGSRMSGEIYAKRFIEFAKAMKAVDPDILIGGSAAANDKGGFIEDMLRVAGEHVDFVTFHTYPVERHLDSELDIFRQMFSIRESMERIRGWIKTYVPDRADEIEIGITEWNSKVVEDRDTGDLINGLWTAVWVGEMFGSGVSFATQWDLLTETETGGHGLFEFADGVCMPKSQFWGLYLWSRFMENNLLDIRLNAPDHLFAYATKSEDVLSILLVNASRDDAARIEIQATGAEPGRATVADLSFREYFWNPFEHRPMRSSPPVLRPLDDNEDGITVVPFSARVIRIPFKGKSDPLSIEMAQVKPRDLELILPDQAPADLRVEGWVVVDGKAENDLKRDSRASLSVEGPASLSTESVRIGETAGRFYLAPEGEGEVVITAEWNGLTTKRSLMIAPVSERSEIVWEFERDSSDWTAVSSFSLEPDDSVRPNRQVAAVRLKDQAPVSGSDTLLAFEAIPADVPLDKIGGVVFDLFVSPDFKCEDQQVALGIILQSEGEHWIPLQQIPLMSLKEGWQTLTVRLPDPKYHKVMGHTYALRFQISQKGNDKKPVQGSVYFDKVGFLLR